MLFSNLEVFRPFCVDCWMALTFFQCGSPILATWRHWRAPDRQFGEKKMLVSKCLKLSKTSRFAKKKFRQIGDRHIGDLAPDPHFLNPRSVSIYANRTFGNPSQSKSHRVAISQVDFFFSHSANQYAVFDIFLEFSMVHRFQFSAQKQRCWRSCCIILILETLQHLFFRSSILKHNC